MKKNVESVRLNPLKKKVLKSVIYADMVAMTDLVSAIKGLLADLKSIQENDLGIIENPKFSISEQAWHKGSLSSLRWASKTIKFWLADVVQEVED